LPRTGGRKGDPEGATAWVAVWCDHCGVNWRPIDVLRLWRTVRGHRHELDCVRRTLAVLEILWPIRRRRGRVW
jgi:hypothetical protein